MVPLQHDIFLVRDRHDALRQDSERRRIRRRIRTIAAPRPRRS